MGMRILVAALTGPTVDDAARKFVADLEDALGELGHQVDNLSMPATSSAEAALECMYAARFLDLGPDADRLLTIGGACHALRHPAKICLVPDLSLSLDFQEAHAATSEHIYLRAALFTAFSQSRRVLVDSGLGRATLADFEFDVSSVRELPSWKSEDLEQGLV